MSQAGTDNLSSQSPSSKGPSSAWCLRVAEWVAEAGILNEDVETHVKNAFSKVPREPFIETEQRRFALGDVDLPIPYGQKVFRPSLLIRIASLINIEKRMRVLVAGSGSGYLCAVLHAAGAQVFGVESIAALAQSSRKLLDGLGHHGVVISRGDGTKGWEDASPFDAVIVAFPVIDELELPLRQLAVGGALVVPVVCEGQTRLTLWRRSQDGYKRTVFEEIDC